MKGNLLLDSYSNVDLNNNSIKCRISLTQPGWFYGVDINLESLFPTTQLLKSFKEGELTNRDYTTNYINRLLSDPRLKEDLDIIKSHLDSGKDVTLLCWCGFDRFCHRLIIGSLFVKMGYNVYRVNKDNLVAFDGCY